MMDQKCAVQANYESNNITEKLSNLEDQQSTIGNGLAQITYLLTGKASVEKPIEPAEGIQGRVDRLRAINRDMIDMISVILEVL